MKRRYLILSVLFFGLAAVTNAQRSNGLTVEGVVSVEQGAVDGAVIEMYRNGRRLDNYGIGNSGHYRVELNYNNEFELIFSRRDNFPQKIVVDTHVPQRVLQSDPLFPAFPVNIKLFTEIPGIDRTFSENTVLKIYYSEKVDNFISDLYYNDAQIKHLIDQAILQSQQLDKEADHLEGLTKAEIAELKREYDQLIKEAENEYNREEFLAALDGYKAANKLFPKEQYPKDRIAEINDLLGLLMVAEEMEQALTARLQALVLKGDQLFEQKKYEASQAAYQRALSVDEKNNHAQARLAEIKEILNKIQTDRQYDAFIVAADNSFDELLYAEARNSYLKALELKSTENYPQQRVAEIDEILKQQELNAEKLEGYRESIFQAELNFEKQFYDRAISYYENALVHKPGDAVAIKKIEEIKALMNELANKTLYDKRIKTADKAFRKEQYQEALLEYEEAAKLMPANDYPRSRIDEIQGIFAEQERLAAAAEAEKARLAAEAAAAEQARLAALQAEKEQQYTKAIAQADSLFHLKAYEDSRASYQAALQLNPEEEGPARRIKEIDELLVQLAAAQQTYDAALSAGDKALEKESFGEAKMAYLKAQQAKPEEPYPGDMLAKIDSIVETRARLAAEKEAEQERLAAEAAAAEQARLAALEAAKEQQYSLALSQADSLFATEAYEEARTAYQSALQLKPEEDLPGRRIKEIDQLLVELAAVQKAYDAAIAEGNTALQQESFDVAKQAYLTALQAKPEESYPKDRLAQIDSIAAARVRLAAEAEAAEQARLAALEAEKEQQYNQSLSAADSLFKLEEYKEARDAYQAALQVKPGEDFPAQRINEINELMDQLAAAQQVYEDAVSRGDKAFSQEAYDEAKTAYLEAQQAKPEDGYPKNRLAQIDSITVTRARLAAEAEAAEQARLAALEAANEQRYNQMLLRADSLFGLAAYEDARTAYQTAGQLKPEEDFPVQRMREIDELLDKLAAAQQAYDDAVSRGDDLFNQEAFDEAKTAFLEAQQAKAEEKYPLQMIDRIDSIVQMRARLAAEAEAERARLAEEAEAAEQARLAALEADKERQYHSAVTRADSLFSLKQYEESRSAYRLALQVKGEEKYPQQRIEKVNELLNALELARKQEEKLEQDYQEAIRLADQHFNAKDFLLAKASYEQALELKPDATFPKERIAEADNHLLKAELEKKYRNVIAVADSLFKENAWKEARKEYETALAIQSGENYPQSQILKIDNLLKQQEEQAVAEQQKAAEMERRRKEIEQHQQAIKERQEINDASLNQLYKEYVSLADGFFENRKYNVSRAWYFKAWDVKPDESYPPQRIEEIKRIVSSLMLNQRDRDYQHFVDLADSTFRENQLAVSRGWYNRALTVKPEESYPKEQLQAIADLIAERMAGRSGAQYDNSLQKATEAYGEGNYNVARYWYKKALELRPDDKEAKEKLMEIEKALK